MENLKKKRKKKKKKVQDRGTLVRNVKLRLSVSLSLVSVSALWNVTMYHTVCGMLQCITLCDHQLMKSAMRWALLSLYQ